MPSFYCTTLPENFCTLYNRKINTSFQILQFVVLISGFQHQKRGEGGLNNTQKLLFNMHNFNYRFNIH